VILSLLLHLIVLGLDCLGVDSLGLDETASPSIYSVLAICLGDLKRDSFGINRYRAVSGLFDRGPKTGRFRDRVPK
jgi:hypothetical protein